jgi:SAM-dependent methyltransferase
VLRLESTIFGATSWTATPTPDIATWPQTTWSDVDIGRNLRITRRYVYGKCFDLRYRVETTRTSGPRYTDERRGYEPSETWQMLRILPPAAITPTDVFADVGCGKGRALVIAAHHYSFQRVMGVEISAEIYEIAQRNVARMRQAATPIELIHSDVDHWKIPQDVTVFYLFNPFTGHTFGRFVEKVVASQQENPRRILIVYVFPVMGDVLTAQGFRMIRQRRNLRLYARPLVR